MGALALLFLSKFFPVLLLLTFLKRVRLAHVGLIGIADFRILRSVLEGGDPPAGPCQN
jgi:hypothetical protein